jgi:hypothetical protein
MENEITRQRLTGNRELDMARAYMLKNYAADRQSIDTHKRHRISEETRNVCSQADKLSSAVERAYGVYVPTTVVPELSVQTSLMIDCLLKDARDAGS